MQIIKQYFKEIYNQKILFYCLIFLLILDSFWGIDLLTKKNEDMLMTTPLVEENKEKEVFEEEEKTKIKVDLKGAVEKPGVYEVLNDAVLNDLIAQAGGFNDKAAKTNISLVYELKEGLVINIPSISQTSSKQTKTSKVTTNNASKNLQTVEKEETSKDLPTLPKEGTAKDKAEEKSKDTSQTNSQEKNTSSKVETPKEKESHQPEDESKPHEKVVNEPEEDLPEEPIIEEEPKIVNINTASVNELMTLNGIGKAKAQAIIDYRNNSGLFGTIEEIKNVKGIGDAIFAKIKDFITV